MVGRSFGNENFPETGARYGDGLSPNEEIRLQATSKAACNRGLVGYWRGSRALGRT